MRFMLACCAGRCCGYIRIAEIAARLWLPVQAYGDIGSQKSTEELMRQLASVAIVVLVTLLTPPSAAAEAAADRAADRACKLLEKNLEVLIPATRVGCMVPRKGLRTMVIVSPQRVFSSYPDWRIFLVHLVAAAGDAVAKNPAAGLSEIAFMDRDLGEQRKRWAIDAGEAQRLQTDLKTDRITLKQFLAAIESSGKVLPLSPDK